MKVGTISEISNIDILKEMKVKIASSRASLINKTALKTRVYS